MKFVKWHLTVLGSLGVSFLASCSNIPQGTTSVSSPSASKTMMEEQKITVGTVGAIEPVTQTGKDHISLKTTAELASGKNTLMLAVVDAKSGKPSAVKNVAVQMVMSEQEMKVMGMEGAGTAKTQAKPGSALGMFEIQTSLPYGGKWQLKVTTDDLQPTNAVFNLAVK